MTEAQTRDPDRFPTPSLEWSDVLRVLGSIAGFIGTAGALLWLFGRFYYSGAFAAFGFPTQVVSLNPENYLERGAARLVYLLIDILISVLLYYLAYIAKIFVYEKILQNITKRTIKLIFIIIVFSICITASIYIISTNGEISPEGYFFENIINLVSVLLLFIGFEAAFLIAPPNNSKKNIERTQNSLVISSQTPIAIARILMLIIMLASFIFTHAWSSFASGQQAGCMTTLGKATSIVIFSNDNILAEGQSQTGNLYKFDGYFLLFTDKNNYYLFRNINPSTNKPESYFIVNKDVLKTVQITRSQISNKDNDTYNKMCKNAIDGDQTENKIQGELN